MRFKLLVAAALLSANLVAHANTYTFTVSGPTDSGSGTITATATGTPGQFLIGTNGMSGTYDGSAITSVLAVGTYPPLYPPENDNLFFYPSSGGGYFDESGVSFETASGLMVNLFYGYFTYGTNDVVGPGYFAIEGPGQTVNQLTSFTAAPAVTPEPSSFVLLGTGLLGLAGVVKRRIFT